MKERMNNMSGELKSIWIKRINGGPMDPVIEAGLVENRGILYNADQGRKRQVTIIEEEVWNELMEEMGASLDPSARRANLMVSGVNLKESRGKTLKVGDCEIEIYGETKPCYQMDEALPGLESAMFPEWKGGAFGVVKNNGRIKIGDIVELIEK